MHTIQNELSPTQCRVGILIMENISSIANDEFINVKQDLENLLREKYSAVSRSELKALHPMDKYVSHYKKHGYTYHVLGQLESIIKGKSIPSVLPCVEAMFMAELKNMLLTAGHDLDKITFPIRLIPSTGKESFVTMSDKEVMTVNEDLMITDENNILSSILRGPDKRTAITKNTSKVIYTVYILLGVDDKLALAHLKDIETYVKICSPDATAALLNIY